MGGRGTVPHCAGLSSFVATMGKVSRAVAGGAFFRAAPQLFKYIKYKEVNFRIRGSQPTRIIWPEFEEQYVINYIHRSGHKSGD